MSEIEVRFPPGEDPRDNTRRPRRRITVEDKARFALFKLDGVEAVSRTMKPTDVIVCPRCEGCGVDPLVMVYKAPMRGRRSNSTGMQPSDCKLCDGAKHVARSPIARHRWRLIPYRRAALNVGSMT